jgi:hypothetical protein
VKEVSVQCCKEQIQGIITDKKIHDPSKGDFNLKSSMEQWYFNIPGHIVQHHKELCYIY